MFFICHFIAAVQARSSLQDSQQAVAADSLKNQLLDADVLLPIDCQCWLTFTDDELMTTYSKMAILSNSLTILHDSTALPREDHIAHSQNNGFVSFSFFVRVL